MRRGRSTPTVLRFAWLAIVIPSVSVLLCACQTAECPADLDPVDGRCVERKCEPCATHEICDTSDSPAECRCAPGYDGDPCEFVGLIVDPEFRGLLDPSTGEPAWVGSKGAVVEPFGGFESTGQGFFDGSVVCNAGSLTQLVQMPSYDTAQPFLVEVDYRVEVEEGYEGDLPGLAVGFNRSWKQLPPAPTLWTNQVFCLGEGGYGEGPNGGPVELRISATELLADCEGGAASSGVNLGVDRFTIQPAGELDCPAPGAVVNGSADVDDVAWRVLPTDAAGVLEASVGYEASDGARLQRDGDGSAYATTMSTQVSVPLPTTLSTPALQFWWRGTTGRLFEVELGTLAGVDDRGRQVDTLVGTIDTQIVDNRGERVIYCLPPWTYGMVLDLSFSLPEGTEPVELVVDDVTLTSDEDDCGNDDDLFDPSFDTGNRWFGASLGSSTDRVLLREVNGNGELELRYSRNDAEPSLETYVFVPKSDGVDGPVLRFEARSPIPLSKEVQARIGERGVPARSVTTSVDGALNQVCLPAQWTERWLRVQVGVVPLVGASEGAIGQESVFLDDFSLGTSPDCAAN